MHKNPKGFTFKDPDQPAHDFGIVQHDAQLKQPVKFDRAEALAPDKRTVPVPNDRAGVQPQARQFAQGSFELRRVRRPMILTLSIAASSAPPLLRHSGEDGGGNMRWR